MPLLGVFARLHQELPDRRLLLVLAGSSRDGAADVVRARVDALGLGAHVRIDVDPHAPQLLMSAADVFVSPADSIQEAFGLTPVEAMAAGIPQVVARWNGYAETVVDGETGFLIPTVWADCADDLVLEAPLLSREWLDHLALGQSVAVDLDVLHLRLRQLVLDPALRHRMGEASRRRAVERYAASTIAAAYEALWTELGAQADQDRQPPRTSLAYSDPPFWRAFGHYASRTLADTDQVTLTGTPAPSPHASVIDAALADAVVATLGGSPDLSVGALVSAVAATTDASVPKIRRHVLWLLKSGALALRA